MLVEAGGWVCALSALVTQWAPGAQLHVYYLAESVNIPFRWPAPTLQASLMAVCKPQARPRDREHALEKGVAAPCSVLAWRIPRTQEPGRL